MGTSFSRLQLFVIVGHMQCLPHLLLNVTHPRNLIFAQTRRKSSKRDVCYPCKIFPWCKCIYWKGKVVADLYFFLPFTTVCNVRANAGIHCLCIAYNWSHTKRYLVWVQIWASPSKHGVLRQVCHPCKSLFTWIKCVYYAPTVEVKLSQMCTCSSVMRKCWLNTRAICRF